jgi:hypothetical protein
LVFGRAPKHFSINAVQSGILACLCWRMNEHNNKVNSIRFTLWFPFDWFDNRNETTTTFALTLAHPLLDRGKPETPPILSLELQHYYRSQSLSIRNLSEMTIIHKHVRIVQKKKKTNKKRGRCTWACCRFRE